MEEGVVMGNRDGVMGWKESVQEEMGVVTGWRESALEEVGVAKGWKGSAQEEVGVATERNPEGGVAARRLEVRSHSLKLVVHRTLEYYYHWTLSHVPLPLPDYWTEDDLPSDYWTEDDLWTVPFPDLT